uniref:Uncharacterized protein n=1 Tax=Anguilla anguilla TaxID=7936 RepID=A0A0E9UCV5_ANGAN
MPTVLVRNLTPVQEREGEVLCRLLGVSVFFTALLWFHIQKYQQWFFFLSLLSF